MDDTIENIYVKLISSMSFNSGELPFKFNLKFTTGPITLGPCLWDKAQASSFLEFMIPEIEGAQYIPTPMTISPTSSTAASTPTTMEMASGPIDYSLPKRLDQDDRTPIKAWSRLEWLLSAFKANGQKCNMQTALEATFRGDDLFYTSQSRSQGYSRFPSSTSSSVSSSTSSLSSFSSPSSFIKSSKSSRSSKSNCSSSYYQPSSSSQSVFSSQRTFPSSRSSSSSLPSFSSLSSSSNESSSSSDQSVSMFNRRKNERNCSYSDTNDTKDRKG
ncbi:putative serine-rich protein C21513-like isoform X2 [Vespula squamosa]|uniref:Serine-rich protein C21513-like isoform X2 n=1 Tax=Vespula squamosa TaxID=30214 RepID=A0ABD2C5Z6_VESSQ